MNPAVATNDPDEEDLEEADEAEADGIETAADTSAFNAALEDLLEYLKRIRGFDFTGYKRASLLRRIEKRMQTVRVENFSDYQDYLEFHPDEFSQLFNTILINVTAFFRDPPIWEYFREEIIPALLAAKPSPEPIRVWSAGCASGQEVCSLAILLAEKMGMEQFRERVKIYGTDLDEGALAQARAASYSPREVQGVSLSLLEKYFEFEAGKYVLIKDLRRALIFGRHDLLQDAPISRTDLLFCRNTLMYFNVEAQSQILSRFHYAIADGGCLFLGKAEMLFSHGLLFQPLDLKRRVFAKVVKTSMRDRLALIAQVRPDQINAAPDYSRLCEVIFHTGPAAHIVVDMEGLLALASEQASRLFRLGSRDIGRPLQDLEISYRPVELRSCMEQAYAERRPVTLKDIPWSVSGRSIFLDVLLTPLHDDGRALGMAITFTDVTRTHLLTEEMQRSLQDMKTMQEEIQSTSEELETTNEELYSTVEELETSNEELQSTNEELETTNEELQSANGELQAVNEEFQMRSGELNQINAFLESILTSLRGGVVVLDRELKIQIWNSRSQYLWGLHSKEVLGKPFLALDIGLSLMDLLPAIQSCLSEESRFKQIRLAARNRSGKDITCQIGITPLRGAEDNIFGVILVMEEEPPP